MKFSTIAILRQVEINSQLILLQSVIRAVRNLPSRRTKAGCVHMQLKEAVVGVVLDSFKSESRTSPTLKALGCFIVLIILAGPAFAAKHPVPLDPKADTSTCIACHEDKTK